LSLKRTQPEPWAAIGDKYIVGDVVAATITRLTTFGAFARVEGSIEGLIHISELSDRMISHPKEVVREGDQVTVKIIKIEPDRRRMGLSMKAVVAEDEVSYGSGDTEHRIEQPALNAEMAAQLSRAVAEADDAAEAEVNEPVAEVEEEPAAAEAEASEEPEESGEVEEEVAD